MGAANDRGSVSLDGSRPRDYTSDYEQIAARVNDEWYHGQGPVGGFYGDAVPGSLEERVGTLSSYINDSSEINSLLRGGGQQMRWGQSIDEVTGQIDSLYGPEFVTTRPIDVFRGISVPDNVDDILAMDLPNPRAWKVGEIIRDKAYTSTTVYEETAASFSQTGWGMEGWSLKIRLPKGTQWIPGDTGQGEMMLARDSMLKVVKVDSDARVVMMELVT